MKILKAAILLGSIVFLAGLSRAGAGDCPEAEGQDCNSNGIPDACDIDSGASQDCNSNRIPDECELERGDCDRNGLLDACQEDCDGDLLPDVCEILEGTAADCNGNGRIDACEVAQGESQDCNANGVPDGCELMAAPGFGGPRGFWVGPTLSSAPVGDFDGDGDLDFAALETGYQGAPGRISLLLNEGKGTFSYQPVDPGFSCKPVFGTTGDFGGDGSTDLAVATDDPPRIVVLINKKGGAMEAAGFAQIEAHPVSIAAHDLDGDGDLDLCAAAFGSAQGGSVWVLRNLGGGNLEAAAEIPLAGLPASIAAADLDLDGWPDLAVACSRGGKWQTGGIVVLWGRGSGEFESPVEIPGSAFSAALSSPSSLTASDLNGDGSPDLVLALGSVLRVFFLQEGGLSWRTMDTPSAFWTTAVVAVDLDGDGVLDLAAGTYNGVQPFVNDGFGGFVPGALAEAGGSVLEIRAGDFDADGDNDLAATGWEIGMVLVFPNQEAGTFSIEEETIPLNLDSPHFLLASDLDGDGRIDLAAGAPWDGPGEGTAVSVLWNQGGGRFGPGEKIDVPETMNRLLAGDFDGDGLADLAVVHADPVAVSILTHVGPRVFASTPPILVADEGAMAEIWIPAAAGDLDGDGALDLAIAIQGGIYFLLNRGAGFDVAPQLPPLGGEPTSLAAGDLDWDGRADLIVSIETATAVYFSKTDVWAEAENLLESAAIADVDGGGEPDFIGATSRGVLLCENRGGGGIPSPGIGGRFYELPMFRGLDAESITCGDLDGDRDQDFVLRHSRSLVLLVNNGRGRFRMEAVATKEPPLGLNAADLDGDGDLDLAFLSSRDDLSVISVLSNRPGPMRDDLDGNEVPDECEAVPPPSRFKRGDANADGTIDLSDAILLLGHLFLGEKSPGCLDAADADGSGTLNITDAVYSLNFLFLGGSAPRAPFPHCGFDPKINGLDCAVYAGCP